MIPLLSALGWLRKAAYTAWGIFARYPLQGIILALCVALAWQAHSKREAISDRDALATRLVEQKAEYEAASEEAKAKAIALNKATEIHYRSIAERADNEAQAALANVRSRADSYARRMRLQAGCLNPAATAKDGSPEGDNGSGDDAEFLAVSRNDFDIMVENSRRMQAVNRWASDLIEAKLAIPEAEFAR